MQETLYNIVRKLHLNQVDKCGIPYHIHCFRVNESVSEKLTVYMNMYNIDLDRDTYSKVALFHDVIEDVENGLDTLLTLIDNGIISETCINAIRILTKSRSEQYIEYINNIITSKNEFAILVKICDIQDHINNLDLIREIQIRNRLANKYKNEILLRLSDTYHSILKGKTLGN